MNEENVSRFLAAGEGGLLEFTIGESGQVIDQRHTAFPKRIAFLNASSSGSVILACGEGPADKDGNTGQVHSFKRPAPLSELELVGSVSSQGVTACHLALSPREDLVSVANFRGTGGRESQGSVALMKLDAAGHLSPVESQVRFPGSGPKLPRQEASHPHATVFTASPDMLRVADLGTDSLWSCRVRNEPEGATLGEPVRQAVDPGSGPRHLISVENGHAILMNTEMSNELIWFQPVDGMVDGREGSDLRVVARTSLLLEGVKGAAAADIQISPDLRFLYISLRGPDLIAVFAIDLVAQTLNPVGNFAAGGQGPRSLALSSDGRFMVVTNTGSRSMKLFRRDLETGALVPLAVELPFATHAIAV